MQVSGELFTLTYGALVAQLLKDYEDVDAVNRQLDKIGYNIGLRMIDDFLAKNPTVGKCNDMREVADVLSKQGFKLYLGRAFPPMFSTLNPVIFPSFRRHSDRFRLERQRRRVLADYGH